jgi:hypothetical protein
MILKIESGSCKSSATATKKIQKAKILETFSMSRMITSNHNKCYDMQRRDNFSTKREYSDVPAWLPRKYCRAIIA